MSGNLGNRPNLGFDNYVRIRIQVAQNRTIDLPREYLVMEFRNSSFREQREVFIIDLLAEDGIRTSPGKVVRVISSTLDSQGDVRHTSRLKSRIILQECFNNSIANGRIKLVGVDIQDLPCTLEKGIELSLRDNCMEYLPLVHVWYSCKRIVEECLNSKKGEQPISDIRHAQVQ